MPDSYFTSKLLELEDVIIEDVQTTNTEIHTFLSMPRRPHICPRCNTITEQIHDYRTSVIKDIPSMGKMLFLHYRKRRYHCPCCNKHFYESFPLLPKHCRITTRLSFYAIHLLKNRQNVHSVASTVGISVSSLFRRMNDVRYPKPKKLPRVLSIDEFKGNAGGQKFQAILTDAENHKLFDILPNRSMVYIMQYLQGFKNKNDVKYVVMDMNQVYRDLMHSYFPNATIVIDKFHGEYADAEKLLCEIREKIEKNIFNEQALAMYEYILLFYTKKISSEEYVDKMQELLRYTVPLQSASKGKNEFYLTDCEEILIYHIAIGYKWAGNYDKAYEVLHELEMVYAGYAEEKLAESHIGMYEFIMIVVAELYLYRKEYEKAEELLQQLMLLELKAKRLNTVHQILALLIYKEVQENVLPNELMQNKLQAGICISQICKDKVAERGYIKYQEDIFNPVEVDC